MFFVERPTDNEPELEIRPMFVRLANIHTEAKRQKNRKAAKNITYNADEIKVLKNKRNNDESEDEIPKTAIEK